MHLDESDIRAFIALWDEEFDEVLPEGEARHVASALLNLYATLYGPTPKEIPKEGTHEDPPSP